MDFEKEREKLIEEAVTPTESNRPLAEAAVKVFRGIAMEDVHDISLAATELVKAKLKEFGIELTDEQEDQIYVPLDAGVEKLVGYPDYRSHN